MTRYCAGTIFVSASPCSLMTVVSYGTNDGIAKNNKNGVKNAINGRCFFIRCGCAGDDTKTGDL